MKIRKGSISYILLKGLEEATKDEVLNTFSYSAQMKYLRGLPDISTSANTYSISATIRRLRLKGLIEQDKAQDSKRFLRLTYLGREALGMEEAWDGRYKVVIWDIPENKRRLRDLLRRRLREFEFKKVQKSVWVSKRNVTDKLRKLIKELEMEKWVVVIESDDPWFSYINFHDRG